MSRRHAARSAATVAVVVSALAVGTAAPALAAPAAPAGDLVGVIVQELPGAGTAPERAVVALGGTVGRELGIIDAFGAEVPAGRLDVLRAADGVRAVTEDAAITLTSADVEAQAGQSGSLATIVENIGASAAWSKGITGQGVDVALIDSGVVPVEGLTTPGKVVAGPDLSVEAQQCDSTGGACRNSPAYGLDGYGHGTAMAGIIAGRDGAAPSLLAPTSGRTDFLGVAPDARIVNVKVADGAGQADVSQVIAGIDWVVANRRANGLNIRVLNLSFGTDGVQDYQLDPLTYAAEVAWRAGIVVVASAGNRGSGSERLTNPAYDPYVIAVGAIDDAGGRGLGNAVVPEFSSRGDGVRNPDLAAPGAAVVSLRSPGSVLDTYYPGARIGSRFFRGSGTSQAAAVTSGAAALLLSQRPGLTNDQVKAILTRTARAIPSADKQGQGAGLVNVSAALNDAPSAAASAQNWAPAQGTGSLEASRGTEHVVLGGAELIGETDVTGARWFATSPSAWTGGSWSGSGYTGGTWHGAAWFGHGWNADHYAGQKFSGGTWVSAPWVPDADGNLLARTWAARTWAASTWAASTWAARTWAARTWAASTWAASTWG